MRLGWDEDSARIFDQLKASGVTIGTMDLRIASIALAYEATLLSRNLKDFQQVPGLKVENWLE
jgi:tRNA(fMet)-specific endonuclease VapC